MTNLSLGRAFDCYFGPFMPRLTFLTPTTLRLEIPDGESFRSQIVTTEVTEIRPEVVVLSWVEEDGTMVVHVHDYENSVVLSHARLPGGTLIRSKGHIAWV
jgi:hypothetical protein